MGFSDQEIISRFKINKTDRILEVGGSMKQHDNIQIDTLVDIIKPEESIYTPSKLKAKKFVRLDITQSKLPFKDKEFDFCLCTHTIEDLTTPFLVLSEMSRVAKRGYIATPSMGKDMEFGSIDMTNYLSGPVRFPGIGHHKWFYQNLDGVLKIIPKNYPILYSSAFQMTKWTGEEEMQLYWEKEINIEVINDLNTHKLIDEYRSFYKQNRQFIKRGVVAVYLDNPVNYIKQLAKLILHRGVGFKYLNEK